MDAPRIVLALSLLAILLGAPQVARSVDQLPHGDESALTWKGITLYGVVDIGLQYQTHGATASDFVSYTTEPVVQKNSNGSVTALTSSPLSWSRIGLSGNEPFYRDWAAVFRVETYFNPTSGNLSDGLKSLTLNNGRALPAQTSSLDSSVAGQLFGGRGRGQFCKLRVGVASQPIVGVREPKIRFRCRLPLGRGD